MSDIEALQREIRAIDFALESYVDFEEEEVARRRHLKENFDSFPGLKRYVLCSASALQDEKKQLRDEIKLLLEKDKAIIEKDKAIIEKEKLIQEEKVILLRREEAHTQPTGRDLEAFGLGDIKCELRALTSTVQTLADGKFTVKRGSNATDSDAKKFFSFVNFAPEYWISTTDRRDHRFYRVAEQLIRDHQSLMRCKLSAGDKKEVYDVQPESKQLLQDLLKEYFSDEIDNFVVDPESEYYADVFDESLRRTRFIGKTDAVVKNKRGAGILCWEVKNQEINVSKGAVLAQLGSSVAGVLRYLDLYKFKPEMLPGVATNGVAFAFIMAEYYQGVYIYRSSDQITDAGTAAEMIGGCFFHAWELLKRFNIAVANYRPPRNYWNDVDDSDGEADHKSEEEDEEKGSAGGGGGDGGGVASAAALPNNSATVTARGNVQPGGSSGKGRKKTSTGPVGDDNEKEEINMYAPLTMRNLMHFEATQYSPWVF